MRIGTKSLLIGAHQFILHPIAIAVGWWKLYGANNVYYDPWPHSDYNIPGEPDDYRMWWERSRRWWKSQYTCIFDRRLWWAFILHDWGYWGLDNMDGPIGEEHPEWGANRVCQKHAKQNGWWYYFTVGHSRFLARRKGIQVSPLCAADKYAITLMPTWFYVFCTSLTGEIYEYMNAQKHVDMHGVSAPKGKPSWSERCAWFNEIKVKLREIALEDARGVRVEHRSHHQAPSEAGPRA